MKLTVLVLTFNEELHLARCLQSILPLTNDIVVVDCFSQDQTIAIAKQYGARVLERAWENNHSTQVNWALTQLPADTEWVMRIDADEYLTSELITQIKEVLPTLASDVEGVTCIRKMVFQGKLIEHGGVGANRVMRIFRYGKGQSEARWMDEHIKIGGRSANLSGVLIDDNLRPLSWWIEKHNNYSSREAVDLLNLKYGFSGTNSVASLKSSTSIGTKRWIKENIYAKLPGGLRAWTYYVWRYIFMMGFLDGAKGAQFHFFQALWYRSLVDAKVAEVERYMTNHKVDPMVAIQKVLGISL
ncbi:glycosyltransferase family 2 protein [Polynucleobacter sp. AP-Latsch-80-C2]|jgi:glycosyltransferase involved in cell wall biosynthesis|uniref:glycosyltransferase family 2 protein n=1 Tax=Polynucleobacter sp. AP-Latsch-80-C2 TaxID=2576931 RepID=UPI001C0BE448|nr:glycosyltransferase family 2 protein [Polynucleobacter sp. AP-Latsch-80-C2]MBU3623199.1 glycosyltransferase family 2 protein [Polynucleobacter sp. AP-Latsch-80-C2]